MNLADKTILNVLAKSSGAVLLLASSIVMARYFSKADFGSFLQVMLIVNTFISLSYFGLPQSIYYFYPSTTNRSYLLIQSVALSIGIAILGALFIYNIRELLVSWLNNPRLIEYIIFASIMVLTRGPAQFREPILISDEKLIFNSVLIVICNTLFYLPTIVGPFFYRSLEIIFRMMSIACIIELLLYIFVVSTIIVKNKRDSSGSTAKERKDSKVKLLDQLRYGLPIGASSYMGIIGKQLDQYIISVFFKPGDFAVYSRGAMRLPVIGNFQIMVNNILMPEYVKSFSDGDIDRLLNCFHNAIERVAKVKFPVSAFLFAIAHPLIVWMYTPRYDEAASVLRVYLIYLVIGITVYGIIPRATGNTKYILHSTIAAITCNIVLSLLLIKLLGPIGAAIGTIISSFIMAGYLLRKSAEILKVSIRAIFPWRFLGKVLGLALIASSPLYAIQYFFPVHGAEFAIILFVEACLFIYLYAFMMMRFGLISLSDMEIASRWLRVDLNVWLPKLTFCSLTEKD